MIHNLHIPKFFIRNKRIILFCTVSTVILFQLIYQTSLSGIYQGSATIPLPLTNKYSQSFSQQINLIVKQYVNQEKDNISLNSKYYPDIFYLGNKVQIFFVNNSILIRAIGQSEVDANLKLMTSYKVQKLLILKYLDIEIMNLSSITENDKNFISQVKKLDNNESNQIFTYLILKEITMVMNKISNNENIIAYLKNYRGILLDDYKIKSTLVFNSAYFFLYLGIFFGALLGLLVSICNDKFQQIKFFNAE